MAPALVRGNLSDPVPLPGDIHNNTHLHRLAAIMPPVPDNQGRPDPKSVLASIQPPEPDGSAGRNGKRQSTMRVIVVGDSILHGNEGDFT